jgi:hypothetical protein
VGSCGLDSYGEVQELFALSCEHGHKIADSIKVRKLLSNWANISLSTLTLANGIM